MARPLAGWLAPTPVNGWGEVPPSVTVSTGTAPDRRRVHIVHNWNWDPVSVTAPRSLTDVLAGTSVAADAPVRLGPWDVRVFVSDEER